MKPLIDRLMDKIEFTDDCWNWTGSRNPKGYGMVRVPRDAVRLAHRVVWQFYVEPLADGQELDHLCRNRACVNPDHLEPVTHRENVLRGTGFAARNARKTHCPNGHEYTDENTYHWPGAVGSSRQCRACKTPTD